MLKINKIKICSVAILLFLLLLIFFKKNFVILKKSAIPSGDKILDTECERLIFQEKLNSKQIDNFYKNNKNFRYSH